MNIVRLRENRVSFSLWTDGARPMHFNLQQMKGVSIALEIFEYLAVPLSTRNHQGRVELSTRHVRPHVVYYSSMFLDGVDSTNFMIFAVMRR